MISEVILGVVGLIRQYDMRDMLLITWWQNGHSLHRWTEASKVQSTNL
jgi:hypothetical protein